VKEVEVEAETKPTSNHFSRAIERPGISTADKKLSN
jgi:hypothetical protein